MKSKQIKVMAVTAILMAFNIVLSSFGVPVPGGHMYLNDVIICTAAILLDPVGAFAVGGIGAFLGDFFFYPTPMFVSLVVHGRSSSRSAHASSSGVRTTARASRFSRQLSA